MARCGCNAASATTCDAIVLCVAANLGPGLRYDAVSGALALRLSGDAGNAARFGSDWGIYVPGEGANPDPVSGRKTVAGLGARIVGASRGGAGSMLPFGSSHSIEYGVANRLDFVAFHAFALADNVAVNRWVDPDLGLNTRTDNPSNIPVRDISSLQLPFLLADAGTRQSPTGRTSGAPAGLLTPDGGWFGFYAPQFTPQTLAEALWALAARSVAVIVPYGNSPAADVARNLDASIAAVVQTLAQDWTIISVPAYTASADGSSEVVQSPLQDWVDAVSAAGITPMVDLFDEKAAAATPGARWTPDEISATQSPSRSAGLIPIERIQELADAGLDVVAQTNGRHWETTQMYGAGVRGVMSDTPVYSRGARGETGDLDYRKTRVIPGLTTRTTMEGSLTRLTETGISTSSGETGFARQSAQGRYFPARFNWDDGYGKHLHSQLLGELCPFASGENYDLRIRFRTDPQQTEVPSGSAPKLGVFFGAPDDRNITWQEGEDASHVNGYAFWVRIGSTGQGDLVLTKWNNGVETVLDNGSVSLPSVSLGDWVSFLIQVRNPTLTLTAGHRTVPDDEPDPSVSVEDTDHRGLYAHYIWEDDYLPPATNEGFGHGYDAYPAFATNRPMYQLIQAGG
jgi:hypothetical protein